MLCYDESPIMLDPAEISDIVPFLHRLLPTGNSQKRGDREMRGEVIRKRIASFHWQGRLPLNLGPFDRMQALHTATPEDNEEDTSPLVKALL